MKIKTFTYTKSNKEVSHRVVAELIPASDNMLAIDLTQLEDDERETIVKQLNDANRTFLNTIERLGLNKLYRNFKRERIS